MHTHIDSMDILTNTKVTTDGIDLQNIKGQKKREGEKKTKENKQQKNNKINAGHDLFQFRCMSREFHRKGLFFFPPFFSSSLPSYMPTFTFLPVLWY